MQKVALLAGARVLSTAVDDDALLLLPPPPLEPLVDVRAAVAEALRYPLSGPSLKDMVTRGGRATIVVEPPVLPLPGAETDPRREALAAVVDELQAAGVPAERQTVLVAGGLGRRGGRREQERVLTPARARSFRGFVLAHDCTGTDLRELAGAAAPARIAAAVLDTDLVVTVGAAESAEHGGAAALLAACDADTIARPAPAASLLEPAISPSGRLAASVEKAVASVTPVIGVSLVLDHPRLSGRYRGYPWSAASVRAVSRSPLRSLHNLLPRGVARLALQSLAHRISPAAALAGLPSVAHAEALLRGITLRGIRVDEQLDTVLVPLPWVGPHLPRLPLNPITAASTGLGLALRLWRERSPLREGGTVILLHDLRRRFGHGEQATFTQLFRTLQAGRERGAVERAEAAARTDERSLAAYRAGQAPHPLLPFCDWASASPVLERCGRVIVAGCRDAGAARALGFVPSHNLAAALEMARGVAGGSHRLGVLLAPPFAPLIVGPGTQEDQPVG